MTQYANLITSDCREETKHVFLRGVSRIVCRFSTTGAQNPQFVNLTADFKSKALLFMCKTCIRIVKVSAQKCTQSRHLRCKIQKFLGGGALPPPQAQSPVGRGTALPTPYPPRRFSASILAPTALTRRLDSRPPQSKFLAPPPASCNMTARKQ